MIQLLICDDHQIVRQGMRQMLADVEDMRLVGEASDGVSALRLAREAEAAGDPQGRIDVVLLDIAMPHRDGLDVLRQFRTEFRKLPVLMLSAYPGRQYAVRSIKLGAAGYLNKGADAETVTAAIRKVAGGGIFVSIDVAEQLARALAGNGVAAPDTSLHESLSRREFQVFRMLASGRTIGEIAQQLALSGNTVSTYRARVLEKTGTRNDVELALYAMRADLPPDE